MVIQSSYTFTTDRGITPEMKKPLWIPLIVGMSLSPNLVADDRSIFYDDYLSLCTIFGGRMSESTNNTAENIYKSCQCIDDYIVEHDITHEGLRIDLAISVFSDMEYYLQRDGLSTEEQFHHITEVITQCTNE